MILNFSVQGTSCCHRHYRVSPLRSKTFFPLDDFLTWAPLVLQSLIKGDLVDILAPPLAPAGEEDLLGVSGEVVPRECPQYALGPYIMPQLATMKTETGPHGRVGNETYLLAQSLHQACPWLTSSFRGGRCQSEG